MAWSRPLLLAGLVALLALAPAAAAAPADGPQPARPVRVVLLPLKLPGEPVPTRPQLERLLRGLSGFMARASYGRLRVSGQVAPVVAATRRLSPTRAIPAEELTAALRSAGSRGVRLDGAIPMFIAASRQDARSFATSSWAVIRGRGWTRLANTVAHELAHVLGLDHAAAPSACPRPFRPIGCAIRPADVYDYGDLLDVMGGGSDRLGAFPLAALGLAPVRDAPAGRAGLAVRPLQGARPTLLRLRTAAHDWYVESRTTGFLRNSRGSVRLPPGVAISRVPARYALGSTERFPMTLRVPAAPPGAACSSPVSCLSGQLFRPGRTLTVPGAFRLRVLGPGPRGSTRVQTTWLDRTPPALSVTGATIVRTFGGGAELAVAVGAQAAGAGVASVLIDQAGTVSRVDADTVPGIVAGGRGSGVVRTPLVPGASAATVRLVDAAGNASAPAAIDLATLPGAAAATVGFDPPLGAYAARATQLPGGQAVTVSGVTDPTFAGLTWDLEVIGTATRLTLPIGPGGVFSGTWTPSGPGVYTVVARVPVERIAGGVELRVQTVEGWVRA